MKTTKWKVFIAECLCMCFVGSYSFTSPYSRVIKCNTRRYFVPRNNVPVELTTLDKLDRGALSELTRPQNNLLLPNTDIVTLSGGENLGFILWSYILCNGLFPVLGKPTNWLVTPIAKLLNQTEEQWYLDKQDGFAFTCPPMVDFIRIAIFCILGFFVNRLVIASFSGDVFWSWSIGICLAIPSALINAAREPLETRTSSNLQSELKKEFQSFAENKLVRAKQRKVREDRLLMEFRRQSSVVKKNKDIEDRILKKVMKQVIGAKRTNGVYEGIEFISNLQDVERKKFYDSQASTVPPSPKG